LASPEWHELAGQAKDAAAAAVLIVSVGAAVVGLIIFLPKLIALTSI
jgi:diacylglycerol kinase